MLTAVVGINWGDEGKGRMVDLLSKEYDIICRYQGGNNAGHTVVNEKGKFILNLLPSGILRENTVNVMGNGMVIDIEHLCGEIERLREKGVRITPDNLKISDKAFICMPYHKQQDILEEERLAEKKYGSTRRGIAPVYGDKYMKKGIRMGDLLCLDTLEGKIADILEWKNLTLRGYGQKFSLKDIMQWINEFGKPLIPFITDTTKFLTDAVNGNKNILFEAQLGALRDIDFGIYPFTTSSQTLAAYAPIGAGIPGVKLDHVIGIMKAYSSCVGEGPFTAEFFGEEAEKLREAGGEYGAATGRPRRVGAFDIPASRYGVKMQGADEIALTKLDVLSYMDKIPVCVAYEIDGVRCDSFPTGDRLLKAKPVFEYLDGFKTDISKCRTPGDLPEAALKYIRFIEEAVGCPIKYVSVGPGRDDYIEM
ncbi:adenylosuccinate synthetase PurA [Thermoclostridium stercorarium subsp. stercorarium DSM 8532]|jgi:adenylosuccinate synthase|uniref:Adenylosuccinate synthetase n=3 Tax=Thermoclostridium stercorarium TaxID=1510 RepID=L7VQU9_THES1|nr:adenylosuccinate synthase [Thermoclostridium stercorarium]AGC68766.1 adenylosuccinate synthetase PurA [Thermoclostridium stercorarium subsp. stercorarium DSM 8532]AGI39772.1 adenylosuccinate synthetase [Thermoclostridium stercorarium subsp. stercorarium DSM 8532]ANW99087.1 adenylosuccinate synthetase [Thermoclostridium stercorarium subsp. thermolacticum DSM 2910]ANX01623.1 adenylosuccinate synthetase [Thermoclostridium stercorarium subsp. leptospartum DSM 9219]UZQ84734.1 adenylosuccinate sy